MQIHGHIRHMVSEQLLSRKKRDYISVWRVVSLTDSVWRVVSLTDSVWRVVSLTDSVWRVVSLTDSVT